MGKAASDYMGYGSKWLVKRDLTPKNLRKHGINASVKEIKSKCSKAIDGNISTGGRGHFKNVPTYSIFKLKEIFKK